MGLACEGDVLRVALDGSQGAPVMGITSTGIAKFLRTNTSGQLQAELVAGSAVLGAVDQGTRNADGSLGWRIMEFGPSGLPNAYFNIAGIFEIPTCIVGDPNTGVPWSFLSGGGFGLGLVNLKNSVGTECGITGNPWVSNIHQWGGTNTTLGQKAMASSVPVVLANNQSDVPVSFSKAFSSAAMTGPNVTTTSSTVLAAKANRTYLSLVNDSDTTIYVAFGAAAVLNTGIRLNANGGSFTLESFRIWTGDVRAIHGGSGNKVLCILEGS